MIPEIFVTWNDCVSPFCEADFSVSDGILMDMKASKWSTWWWRNCFSLENHVLEKLCKCCQNAMRADAMQIPFQVSGVASLREALCSHTKTGSGSALSFRAMEIGVGFVRSMQAYGNHMLYIICCIYIMVTNQKRKRVRNITFGLAACFFYFPLESAVPTKNRNLSRIVAHYALRSRCRWYGSWKSPATRDPIARMALPWTTWTIKHGCWGCWHIHQTHCKASKQRQVHAKPILVAVLPEKLLLRLEFAVTGSLVICMGKSISV